VPALRQWLTRKQRETLCGRAQLRLAERAALWDAKREKRHLPAWWEWANIRLFTRKKDWTAPPRQMMQKAGRHYGLRTGLLLFFLALLGWGAYEVRGSVRAQALVDQLTTAETLDVPKILPELAPYRRWADPLLAEVADQAKPGSKEQLHAAMALVGDDRGRVDSLYRRLLHAKVHEVAALRQSLAPYRRDLTGRLWSVLTNRNHDLDERLRAACALAAYTPDDARWKPVRRDVAAKLVTENPLVIPQWVETLRPVAGSLLVPLRAFLTDDGRGAAERELSARVYADLARDDPRALRRLEKRLARRGPPAGSADARVKWAKVQAHLGTALVVMGRGEKVWPLLRHRPDPTLRSYLIQGLGSSPASAKALISRLDIKPEVSIRWALLLALGELGVQHVSLAEREKLLPRLVELYRGDPDPGVHAAAEWLLRRWQKEAVFAAADARLRTGKPEGRRRWYVNRQGQTMVLVPRPGVVGLGEGNQRIKVRIDRSYFIASKEVTVEQYRRFQKGHQVSSAPTKDCPVDLVSWYDAAAYCNWLSRQEGIPESEWCYLPDWARDYPGVGGSTLALLASPLGQGPLVAASLLCRYPHYPHARVIPHAIRPAPRYWEKKGYRLPTEWEWEYACRAGSDTPWSCGAAEELLGKYAWYSANAADRSHPVGTVKPNDLGLYDMHGNAWEWCQNEYRNHSRTKGNIISDIEGIQNPQRDLTRVLRGGPFNLFAEVARSAQRNGLGADGGFNFGFRPARTYR
jgi:formylglycine-generating enzyme required for sulfatase activity